MILSDGAIGQVMEKLYVTDYIPRWTDKEIAEKCPWATYGKPESRNHNIITSLELEAPKQEEHNHKLQAKYAKMEEDEVRFEMINCEDADYVFVAYGSSARISEKAMQLGREKGIKVGLLRPITLFPFPKKQIAELSKRVKGLLSVEMSAGQMVEDVRLAAEFRCPVEHYGRYGGVIPTPHEVLAALEEKLIKA
jgi:2-oxoglutarate ferredoxin oxidoreductase subunit alpha